MKKLFLIVALLWSAAASAQFVPGQVLTAAELNSAFANTAPAPGITCLGASSALNYTSNTFSCNAAINAVTLGGATFSAPGPIGSVSTSSGAFSSITTPSATIGGGSINATTVGVSSPSTGSFTTFNASGAATVTTQNPIENTTLIATDQYVNSQIIRFSANVPLAVTGGTYNQAVTGTGTQFVILTSGGVVSSVVSVISGGTGYAVGDMLLIAGGNYDARVRVTNVVGGVIQSGGLQVLYGGTGYTTGATVQAMDVPPGQRTIVLNGTLTSNLTYILQNGNFNNSSRRPLFVNNTTGAFTVTVKISNGAGGSTGTGVVLPQGTSNSIPVQLFTDGATDVWPVTTNASIGALPAAGGTISGNLTVTGTLTPSQTNGIVGTTTNNNANAGSVGEYVTAQGTGVSLTTGTAANITSISLTAGDWDVQGAIEANFAGTPTFVEGGINTTSATIPSSPNRTIYYTAAVAGSSMVVIPPIQRLSLSSTTTVFLVNEASFTSTATATGFIRARRVR